MPDAVHDLRLVDQHCHGVWTWALTRAEFERGLSESAVPPPPGTSAFDSQVGLSVRRWCAPVLDLAPHASADEYVLRRAHLGPEEVHRRLLAAAGLAGLCVDTGYQPGRLTGFEELGALAGAPAREIVRLESVAEAMVADGAGPEELITGFPAALARASRNAVALKSIVAYRVGLDLSAERPADDEARAAAEKWIRASRGMRPRLDDPVLERFVLWCGVDRGLPLQFHCGFGDPDLTLHRSDPALLTEFIRAVESRSVPVVLLHNYPYHRNAAYLAHAFPHVYADVGLALGHAGAGAAAIVAETLEIAPFHKVVYSSDGFALAELHFLGALRFRQALSGLLDNLLAAGEISATDADHVARMVGRGNALRLYGPLDSGGSSHRAGVH